MPNINAYKVVVHEKTIFKGFCSINLYKFIVPFGRGHLRPKGLYLNKLESTCPRDAPC